MTNLQLGRFYLTRRGANLMSKAQTGVPIKFTKLLIGEEFVENLEQLEQMQEVTEPKSKFDIQSIKYNNDGTSSLFVELNNNKVTEGYHIRTLGIYAQDPDLGEILYSVCCNGANADFMKPEAIAVVNYIYELITVVGNANNLEVTVDRNTIYVTKLDFENLAGTGRTIETVKENADTISDLAMRLLLLEANMGGTGTTGKFSVTFEDISENEKIDGVWDKNAKRMVI